MRILQINKFFYRRGGAEHFMFDLSEMLEKHDNEVLFFSMKDKKNEPTDFSKYFVSHVDFGTNNKNNLFKKIKSVGRMFYSFEAKKKIKKLLDKEKIDLVHIHNIYHHISPSILPAIKKKGIPVVMTLHDYKLICPNYTFYHHGAIHEEDGRGWYLSCIKNKCMKNSYLQSLIVAKEMFFHHKIMKYYEKDVDLFIAPSQFVKDIFVRFGWNKKKIKVLPHFLPTGIKIAKEIKPAPQEKKFFYVGRISEEKGIKNLIEYWIENDIECDLEIFGEGPLLDNLKNLVKKKRKEKRIIFHGYKKREEIYKNSSKFTALIVPTGFYEPFGLIVLEAFANGLPIITTGKGALQELADNSKAGILFNWEDKNSLKQALAKIEDKKYREHALQYIKTHHQREEYYQKLFTVYKDIVKS